MKIKQFFIVSLALLGNIGCADKAEPDYTKCTQLENSGDVNGAWTACNAAIAADPNSTSGKAASDKLRALKPRYDQWKSEQAAKTAREAEEQAAKAAREAEEKRQQEEAAQRAAAEAAAREEVARNERLSDLRRKIVRKCEETKPNSDCLGKGLPPYQWDYSGGTFAENAELALSDGCQKEFGETSTNFCCPELPNEKQLLIGKWRCRTSIRTYKSDGTFHLLMEHIGESVFVWNLESSLIRSQMLKVKNEDGTWSLPSTGLDNSPIPEVILSIDSHNLKLKNLTSGEEDEYTRVQ